MTDQPPKRRRRTARKWHRWLGLIAALPVLWLSVSGLMLNHAEGLGLNDRMVSTPWILRHYNQLPEGKPSVFPVGDRMVAEWNKELFLDHQLLPLHGELVGAVGYKSQLVIATSEKIAIFDGSDEMLLELDDLSLPAVPIQAIQVVDEKLHLKAADRTYILSDDFFSSEAAPQSISAVNPRELLPEEKAALEEAIRTRRSMPLARVILDAHSGRLFGWPGWVITDLTAISLLILTILGLRLFPKRKS